MEFDRKVLRDCNFMLSSHDLVVQVPAIYKWYLLKFVKSWMWRFSGYECSHEKSFTVYMQLLYQSYKGCGFCFFIVPTVPLRSCYESNCTVLYTCFNSQVSSFWESQIVELKAIYMWLFANAWFLWKKILPCTYKSVSLNFNTPNMTGMK